MAAKRKASKADWERKCRQAWEECNRHVMALETRREENAKLRQANTELQAVAKAAQETAQTYATNYGKLNQDVLALGREKRALEQRLKDEQAFREEAERRGMERRKTPQSQTPPTCRCSDHEERLRALLERVVGLESMMKAVSVRGGRRWGAFLKGGA